jgi:hypothetical protein
VLYSRPWCRCRAFGVPLARCAGPPCADRCLLHQDEELARQLVELGYHTTGETLKREEFEARQKAEREKHLLKENVPKPLTSMGKDLSASHFLQSLANREELVRNGKLTVRACGAV